MPKRMSVTSTDDIIIPVKVAIPEGGNANITTDVVQFAFVPGGLATRRSPSDTEWNVGFWLVQDSGAVNACITVGPGAGLTLTRGEWAIWIKIEDNPTTPVVPVDQLTIF
jgi:hypothetical protein